MGNISYNGYTKEKKKKKKRGVGVGGREIQRGGEGGGGGGGSFLFLGETRFPIKVGNIIPSKTFAYQLI